MVGYFEYGKALQYFQDLLRRSQPEDIEVYNAYIARDPSLAVYVSSSPDGKSKNAGFKKHNDIFHLMALARVEHGAIQATFMGKRNAFTPKSISKSEVPALVNLLKSDLSLHLKKIARNAEFHRELSEKKKQGSIKTLSYLRRMLLVNQMASTLVKLQPQFVNNNDKAKANQLQQESSMAAYKLRDRITKSKSLVTSQFNEVSVDGRGCGAMRALGRLGIQSSDNTKIKFNMPTIINRAAYSQGDSKRDR